MNKFYWMERLSLLEHLEGGYFAENYRSPTSMETNREGKERAVLTSIYYMLTDDRPIDRFHKNQSDIIHYFHAGSAITYLIVSPQGDLQTAKLGLDINRGEVPQLLVPGGFWKAAVLETGEFGLLGEAVAPGFDYRDMEIGKAEKFNFWFPDLWAQLDACLRHTRVSVEDIMAP